MSDKKIADKLDYIQNFTIILTTQFHILLCESETTISYTNSHFSCESEITINYTITHFIHKSEMAYSKFGRHDWRSFPNLEFSNYDIFKIMSVKVNLHGNPFQMAKSSSLLPLRTTYL